MDAVINRLIPRLSDPQKIIGMAGAIETTVFPPAAEQALRKADDQLGFALPGLLRSIYRHVANGGIGPSYGLLGIASGATDDQGRNAVELYCDFLGYNDQQSGETGDPDHGWNWPERLLPICYRGCTVYECLDCNLRDGPITIVDLSGHNWERPFDQTASSLRSWLEDWLDETDGPEPPWLRRLDDGQKFQTVTWQSFGGELFPSQMPYLAQLKNLKGLGLGGPRITDEHLVHLVHVPQLEALHLHGTKISNDGLRHVATLKNLRHLLLGETPITDSGLIHLNNVPLETLGLSYTTVTDAGLRHLYSCNELKNLDLTSVPVTESGLAALEAALPECEVEWWPQE